MTLRDYPMPPAWTDELPVGGKLQHFTHQWAASDKFLGSVTQDGVGINWLDGPPPFSAAKSSTFSPEERVLVDDEVKDLLEKAAILEIPESQARLICSMFLVAKKGGGQRPVLNLKPLNRHTMPKHFKLEGIPVVRDSLRPDDWMCTVDLTDAFFHIPLKPAHQKFFQFRWAGHLYQYKALPFGWNRSPSWFQSFTRHIAKICRRDFQIRVVCYLDDFW
jgi:hypothetical protein